MFGSEFASHPEILLASFGEMSHSYKKIIKKNKNFITPLLQRVYLSVFGIPEIGFQVRSMYFEYIVNEHIGNSRFKKILDAGSGIGLYSFWLAKKYKKAQIFGGEIDKNKLEFSTDFAELKKIDNVSFEFSDVTRSLGEKKYDLIVNIDVLEHIEDYKKVLKNFHKALVAGGYLFIHTPQPNQKRIFRSLKKWSHDDHLHEGYTPDELKGELKKLGFRIKDSRETFGFFGKLAWELNHLSFKKGFVASGLLFPVLYVVSLLDLIAINKNGLGTAILAVKTD